MITVEKFHSASCPALKVPFVESLNPGVIPLFLSIMHLLSKSMYDYFFVQFQKEPQEESTPV